MHITAHGRTRHAEPTPDATLAEVWERAGWPLNTRCGGQGVCRGCRVSLGAGVYRIGRETVTVGAGETRETLACQTRVLSADARVEAPAGSLLETQGQIVDDFVLPTVMPDPTVRQLTVTVPESAPKAPASDWDRLAAELRRALPAERVEGGLDVLRALPLALRAGARVTGTAARLPDGWRVLEAAPEAAAGPALVAAVDIGTTTVVVVLADPARGIILRRAAQYNQQIRKADDVAARISFCRQPEDLRLLQDLVIQQTINPLLRQVCAAADVAPERVLRLAVAGNTVMAHLFLGLSPEGLGRLPFQAVRHVHPVGRARELGLAMHPAGLVDVLPSIAGYLGGDVAADIHVAQLLQRPEPTLLVDMGTNSEVVLSAADHLAACSTAAGPAFEGAGLLHGRRAAPGAIEHIVFGPALDFQCFVIGGGRPDGLCGSAIIDFMAEGFRNGLINAQGRFDIARLKQRGCYAHIRLKRGATHACVLVSADGSATGQAIAITEMDLSQVLKAKAATYAGMKTLLQLHGRKFTDVRRFVLSGGFARHINLRNAITLGLLPDLPLDRFEVIGNGALAGAYLALVDAAALPAMEALVRRPRVVELNRTADFENNFIDALLIPNLHADEFPS
ncbi:MAG: ASKHA domain-containing protein [Kiritimatiellaeota bacterium]|nr:ASKHA domain-containing protein [Kiritimatiellota bacterium]